MTFLLVQIALVLFINYFAPEIRDPQFELRLASFRQRTAAKPGAVSVACFGSSHVLYGLESARFESQLSAALGRPVVVGNFGYLAAGQITNLMFAKRLLDGGDRPDLVVVEIMPLILGDESIVHEILEQRLPARILRAQEVAFLDSYTHGERPGGRVRWWWSQLPPISVYRAQIMPKIAPAWACIREVSPENYDECGGCPIPFTEQNHERLRSDRQMYRNRFQSEFTPGARACRAIAEVVECCQSAGVPVALLLTPEHPDCRAAYGAENWAKIEQFLADTQRRQRVPVINANDWINGDLFFDGHHTLPQGAEQFTDRLATEAVAPIVERELATRSSTMVLR
jgi:hypothetical protein